MAGQPIKLLIDTSIYIPFINKGVANPILSLGPERSLLFMSAVVLEELYAGAHDPTSIKLLDKLYGVFVSANRLIVPDGRDWQKTGKIVAQLERKHGFEKKYLARTANDILIALCARRIGATVVTNNIKDFLRIREFVDYKLAE
jgi:predicted nucleic acid-binding protein